MDDVFYLGCIGETGHYLWHKNGSRLHHESHPDVPKDFPTKINILDGGLIPAKRSLEPQGRAFLAHVNGWTIISFNDSSVDKRPGSHSVFIIRGLWTFDGAIVEARKAFPKIFERFTFEVLPARLDTAA